MEYQQHPEFSQPIRRLDGTKPPQPGSCMGRWLNVTDDIAQRSGFFMHHCMVDKLWHEWQLHFSNQGYLPVASLARTWLIPWQAPSTVRWVQDRLDSTALGIEYDELMTETPQPQPTPDITALSLNAVPSDGSITAPGENDLFEFQLDYLRRVTLKTFGNSGPWWYCLAPTSLPGKLPLTTIAATTLLFFSPRQLVWKKKLSLLLSFFRK